MVEKMVAQAEKDGLRKAAIILATLDTETAVQICSELDPDIVYQVATQIAEMTTVPEEEEREALREFLGLFEGQEVVDGRSKARQLLRRVLGSESEAILPATADTTQDLERLAELEPDALAELLQHELLQTQAVVLSCLPANKVAEVLGQADEQHRSELVLRMATMGALAPGALEAIGEGVRQLTRSLMGPGGDQEKVTPDFLAAIISSLPPSAGEALMEELRQKAPQTAADIEKLTFTFDDVLELEDRALQLVLRAVDERTLALAMKKLPEDAAERIMSNMSSRAREMLQQEVELLGKVRVSEVEDAQREIAATARELAERGELTLSKSDSEGEEEYV